MAPGGRGPQRSEPLLPGEWEGQGSAVTLSEGACEGVQGLCLHFTGANSGSEGKGHAQGPAAGRRTRVLAPHGSLHGKPLRPTRQGCGGPRSFAQEFTHPHRFRGPHSALGGSSVTSPQGPEGESGSLPGASLGVRARKGSSAREGLSWAVKTAGTRPSLSGPDAARPRRRGPRPCGRPGGGPSAPLSSSLSPPLL